MRRQTNWDWPDPWIGPIAGEEGTWANYDGDMPQSDSGASTSRSVTMAPDSRCHVITVRGLPLKANHSISCSTLPEGVVSDIAHVLARKRDYQVERAADVRSAIQAHAVGPVAIVAVGSSPFSIPAPLDVLFEPTPLREHHARFGELYSRVTGCVLAHPGRRLALRLGGGAVLLAAMAASVVLELDAHPVAAIGYVAVWSVAVAIAALVYLTIEWRSGNWFVIPGGVVVSRFAIGRLGDKAEHFTPAGTTLIVARHHGGWEATLCCGRRTVSRGLTSAELTVLLAGWQSTIGAREIEELFP